MADRLKIVPCENCDGVGEVQFAATSKWGDPTPDGGLCPICGGHGFDIEEDSGDSISLDEMDTGEKECLTNSLG